MIRAVGLNDESTAKVPDNTKLEMPDRFLSLSWGDSCGGEFGQWSTIRQMKSWAKFNNTPGQPSTLGQQ
jgi:hypothetical protein